MNLTKLIELQAAAKTHANNVPNLSGMDSFEDAAYSFDFAALDAKIKRYEDALRFYADRKNYGAVPVCCGNGNIHGCCGNYQPDYEIMNDVGNRAKQALEGME